MAINLVLKLNMLMKKRIGTAGALSLLKKKLLEPFFVMNGDLLTNLDFEKLLDFHHSHNSKATMCVANIILVSLW